MLSSGRHVFTTVLVTLLLTGLFTGLFGGGARRADAHSSDWAPYFMGGMMAGHVLSNIAAQKKAQTEAMQSMAYGGGGGFGRPMPYGQPEGYGRPQQPAPPQPTPQQQLNQLDQLAAGGYITPAEYKARRQAILNAM